MPINLGKSSKGGKDRRVGRRRKRLILGILSALLKNPQKPPRLQYFSRQNTVPAGGRNTEQEKSRYLGFRGSVGKVGGGAPGAPNHADLVGGGGESLFRWQKLLPLCRGPSAETVPGPRHPQPPTLPALADPATYSDCGAFKTFACCTCSALRVLEFLSFKKKKKEKKKKKHAGGWGGGRGSARGKSTALLQL